MKKIFLMLFVAVTVIFASCEKPEGYGGTSGIMGTIIEKSYNDDYSLLVKEEPAVDEEVFVMFGDSETVGERILTSVTGKFEIPYLQPGQYTIYYDSEDITTSDRDNEPVVIEVEVENGQMKDLGILTKVKSLDFDDGTSKIHGILKLTNYRNESVYPFLEIKDISFAQDENVFLIYGNHPYFDARIKTGHNGYFEFPELIPGNYTVYVYSEDLTGATQDIVISNEVTITTDGEDIDMGEIMIYQL